MLGIQVLALDRQKKVAELNRLMDSQPLEYVFFSRYPEFLSLSSTTYFVQDLTL